MTLLTTNCHLMRSRVDTYIYKQNLNDRTSLLCSEKLRVTSQSRVHFAFIGKWRALKFKMQPLKLLVFLILRNILYSFSVACTWTPLLPDALWQIFATLPVLFRRILANGELPFFPILCRNKKN